MGEFSVKQPYDQRQCIVVVPDAVVAHETKALKGLRKKSAAQDRASAVLRSAEAAGDAASEITPAVETAVLGVMKLREAGVDIQLVGASDAARELAWAPGHPFEGVVYVGHPGVPEIYYPIAEFHQRVFEHKFCEAIDLVMSLGASEVEVERREGFGNEEAKALNLAFTPKSTFNAKDSAAGAAARNRLFEASFPGSEEPRMPKATVWLDSERSWQTLARARIRHSTADFSLTVRYENDYGVNARFISRIESVGLQIGGRFHEQLDTIWQVSAEFPPSKGSPDSPNGDD